MSIESNIKPAVTSVISLTSNVTVNGDYGTDDDGYLYVNPNVPGADISTGDRQDRMITLLQQLAAGGGSIVLANQGAAGAVAWLMNLAQISGTPLTLGVKTGAAPIPVVLASDQAPLPVALASPL